MRTVVLTFLGTIGIIAALVMILPVAINFPDSWPGAVVGGILFLGGCALLAIGIRRLRKL